MSKRSLLDVNFGHGGGSGRKQSRWDRPIDMQGQEVDQPLVVEISKLPTDVTEADVLDVLHHFGVVAYVFVAPGTGIALVEFEDADSAKFCVTFALYNPVLVCNVPVLIAYSAVKIIERTELESRDPSPVIVITVTNVTYPITVDVISTIALPFGSIMRIAIGRTDNYAVKVLVEYTSVQSASQAKHALNGADIYKDCCSLKVEFAKIDHLEIHHNDAYHYDFALQDGLPLQQRQVIGPGLARGLQGFDIADVNYQQNFAAGFPQLGSPGGGRLQYYQDDSSSYGGENEVVRDINDRGRSRCSDTDENSDIKREGEDDQGVKVGKEVLGSNTCVIHVTGLNRLMVNCDSLFGLFCQYGNVLKVLFMKSKDDAALIEMGNPEHARCAIEKLNGSPLFGSTLILEPSRTTFLRSIRNPACLPDGSASYVSYANSRNHRFTTPEMIAKNRKFAPCKVIHFFNAPPNITEKRIREALLEKANVEPHVVRVFPLKAGSRSQSGICEFNSIDEAMAAIAKCCHMPLESPFGPFPFIVKFAFFSV